MTTSLEVAVASDSWRKVRGAKRIVAQAIDAGRVRVGLSEDPAEISVVLCDDARIQQLNKAWRGKDQATNVLSFPAGGPGGPHRHLGDIAIAYETVAREATSESKTLSAHLAHMAVHGFLHLAGYDHESDRDAEAMEELERQILASLGIADPYLHTAPEAEPAKKRRQAR